MVKTWGRCVQGKHWWLHKCLRLFREKKVRFFVLPIFNGCHNGWASNILSSRYPPRLKYWMPIHYDTIEDGQNKKSHLLFSFLVYCGFFAFHRRDLFVKNIITSYHWFHLNNFTLYENKCFNPRNQIHHVVFIMRINSVCIKMRHTIRGVHKR